MKNFKIFSFFILIFLPLISYAQTDNGDPLWAKSTTSSSNNSRFNGVAIDSNGNRYGAGYIFGTGSFNFGNGITVSGPSSLSNIVLVKYNASGVTLWAKSIETGSSSSSLFGVATDNNGNVYVAGRISGNSSFNLGNSVTVSGSASTAANIFVAKYDTNGNALWAKSTTSGPNDGSFLLDIAIDGDGDVYVVGFMPRTDTYGFGNGITAAGSSSSNNILLVKYDTSGTTKWAKTVSGSTSGSELYYVTVDNFSNPYIGGCIGGTATFNLGDGVSIAGAYNGMCNTLVAKYNSTGNAQWAKSVTSAPSVSDIKAVALDNDGNIFASASTYGLGTFEFGNGVNITAPYNGYNALLLKYNSTGHAQWAKNPITAPDASKFSGVTSDHQGNAYATGYIVGTGQYNFGNNVTVNGAHSGSNLLLVNYDSSGNAILAKSVVSGNASSEFLKVVSNNTAPGDIYAGGYIDGNGVYNLGNNIIVSGANTTANAVIVKYHGNYTDPESSSSSSSSNKQPIASSSSSSNPAVVSEAPSILPTLFSVGGAILLLF